MKNNRFALNLFLQQKRTESGIFLSFWFAIPKTQRRERQIAHVAVWSRDTELTATLIPVDYFPLPGSSPPPAADLIFPHGMMEFIRRKLTRLGIPNVTGAVSEREVDYGRPLYETMQ